MRKLFSGKRVLEKETNEGSSYFVVPEEKFQKYVVLWGYLIPHGVFNQPNKWVNTYTINPLNTYVLVTEFNPKEYEYMIYEEKRVARQLHQILEPYGIDINNDFEKFVKLEEIPEAAISKVKDCLIGVTISFRENCTFRPNLDTNQPIPCTLRNRLYTDNKVV